MSDFLKTIDSDQGPIEPQPVTLVSNGLEVDLSGIAAAATAAQIGAVGETAPTTDTASSGLNGRLQRIAQRLTTAITSLGSILTALGSPFQVGGSIGNTAFGATQSGAWTVGISPSSTGAKTSVNSAATSATILAANAARKGATISNTDANALYIDLSGGTAAATSYTAKIAADGYYEVPFGYTGLITGIWAADGIGAALVTEFS